MSAVIPALPSSSSGWPPGPRGLVSRPTARTRVDVDVAATLDTLAGQMMASSARIYAVEARQFSAWMATQGLTLDTLTRDDVVRFRAEVQTRYARNTAARKLAMVKRLLEEGVQRGVLASNPAATVRGFRTIKAVESPHIALTVAQVRALLSLPDRRTLIGVRDYALLSLLVRTGLRREEAAALTLADLGVEQGHHVVTIQHGKGDVRRVVKVPVPVKRAIELYRLALRAGCPMDVTEPEPLFCAMRRGGRSLGTPLRAADIARTVAGYGLRLEPPLHLTPHDLRATFVTLALEGGAALHQVQYAVGHADPRTTERYQRRKVHLDNHAVDYVRGVDLDWDGEDAARVS